MEREIWRLDWLESIYELTSFKFQDNFVAKMANCISYRPFDTLVINYHYKVLFGFNYRYYIEVMKYLSPEECEIIKVWHKELEDYNLLINDDSDESIIIRDKLLISLLENGKLAVQKLLAILPNSEKRFLN